MDGNNETIRDFLDNLGREKHFEGNPFFNKGIETVERGVLSANAVLLGRELVQWGGRGFPYARPLLLKGQDRFAYAFDLIARHLVRGGSVVILTATGDPNIIENEILTRSSALFSSSPVLSRISIEVGMFTRQEIIEKRQASILAMGEQWVPLTVIIDQRSSSLLDLFFVDDSGEEPKPEPVLFIDQTLTECPDGVLVNVGNGELTLVVEGNDDGERYSYNIDSETGLFQILGFLNGEKDYPDGKLLGRKMPRCWAKTEKIPWVKCPMASVHYTFKTGVRSCENLDQAAVLGTFLGAGYYWNLHVPTYGDEEGYFARIAKRSENGLSARTGLSPNLRRNKNGTKLSPLDEALEGLFRSKLVYVAVPGGKDRSTFHALVLRRLANEIPSLADLFGIQRNALKGFFENVMSWDAKEFPTIYRGLFAVLVAEASWAVFKGGLVVDLDEVRKNYPWISDAEWKKGKEGLRKRGFIKKVDVDVYAEAQGENLYMLNPPQPLTEEEKKTQMEKRRKKEAKKLKKRKLAQQSKLRGLLAKRLTKGNKQVSETKSTDDDFDEDVIPF